ncbi:MAG TPA: chorismate synthase [Candidatus Atribacteria bacterium]|nr:chorismate synthase [Candidatus Atribacteria bacterium]
MLEFHTAGESHGPGIITLIRGLPANLEIDIPFINQELSRRQSGFGSGKRMEIEKDEVEILAGVRWGKTLGGPVVFEVKNRDYKNWSTLMDPRGSAPSSYEEITIPRPGHADLGGMVKYRFSDLRNVIERASARETVGKCLAGAVAKIFLRHFGVKVGGFVESIGEVSAQEELNWEEKISRARHSPLHTYDPVRENEMIKLIDKVKEEGDTLGGTFVVVAQGVVPGLGSYSEIQERLDSRLAFFLMGIPGIKGVEIGEGFRSSTLRGSQFHDEIFYDSHRSPFPFYRQTFRSGGIEGGISIGDIIWARCAMKPIPTLQRGLMSVDVKEKKPTPARFERSDICAVPRAVVVGEAMLAWVLATVYREKFGGDSIEEVESHFKDYLTYLESFRSLEDGERQ